ncbi:MAG: RagB/SusD family nutrient uptake outer membrane protein [Bacteroidota bacterium]
MKSINKYVTGIMLLCAMVSCNEDEFLKEVPKDFLGPESVYSTVEGFEAGIAACHEAVRRETNHDHHVTEWAGYYRTDCFWAGAPDIASRLSPQTLTPTESNIVRHWEWAYGELIPRANIVIYFAEKNSDIFLTEEQKNEYIAEAKFFRAYGHILLTTFFKNVPIADKHVVEPRYDFESSSREQVLDFALNDLKYASKWLPQADDVAYDGRIPKGAALHLLAETYLSLVVENPELENYVDSAITATSKVIESGQYQLMTERFGVGKNEPGDVFTDLFREGNQNRSNGNRECLWALQFTYGTSGGGFILEGDDILMFPGNGWPRVFCPGWFRIEDPDGNAGMLEQSDSLAHGPGWVNPTNYWEYEIWQSDWDNDTRNSRHNIRREWYYNNPESSYFGQKIVYHQHLDTTYDYYPMIRKFDYASNNGDPGIESIALDMYRLRFSEVLLLRAEAYLLNGEPQKAANDINRVRERVNATQITASDVTLEYILDERARELSIEEHRRKTLVRTGTYIERMQKYNHQDGPEFQEYNRFWPIPQSAIDQNVDNPDGIPQNEGYY